LCVCVLGIQVLDCVSRHLLRSLCTQVGCVCVVHVLICVSVCYVHGLNYVSNVVFICCGFMYGICVSCVIHPCVVLYVHALCPQTGLHVQVPCCAHVVDVGVVDADTELWSMDCAASLGCITCPVPKCTAKVCVF
jgi:hypothetical protein